MDLPLRDPNFLGEYFLQLKYQQSSRIRGTYFILAPVVHPKPKATGKSSKEIVHFILDACSIEEKNLEKHSGKIILKPKFHKSQLR